MVQAAHTAMTSPAPDAVRDLPDSPNSAYTDPSERKWAGPQQAGWSVFKH